MSEQASEVTERAERTADEQVEADFATRERGWLGGPESDTPAAANPIADELLGPEPGEGWEVGPQPEAAAPSPPEVELPVSDDVAAELGVDARRAREFLQANDGAAYAALMDAGLIVDAQSPEDVKRNIAAIEMARQRAEGSQAERNAVLEQAVQWYEDGDSEPAQIVDALRSSYGDAVAGAFFRYWQAQEGDTAEYDVPASPEEYLEREAVRQQQAAQVQQFQAAQQAAAASAERVAAIGSRVEGLEKAGRLSPEVAAEAVTLLQGMVAAGTYQGIADPVAFTDALVQAGAASVRARQLAEFHVQEDNEWFGFDRHSGNTVESPLPERRSFDSYFAEALAQQMPKVGAREPSREDTSKELSAQLDEEFFGPEKVRAAGWNITPRPAVRPRTRRRPA